MTPTFTLTLIDALALGLGLAQAFGIPSATSILPRAIAPAANGMLMGLGQLSMLIGPLLAAGLLAQSFPAGADGLVKTDPAWPCGLNACASASYQHLRPAHPFSASAGGLAKAECD